MRNLAFNTDEEEYSFSDLELIEHLEGNGYIVLGNASSSLDLIDGNMLKEIENLFLTSSCAERLELYNLIKNK